MKVIVFGSIGYGGFEAIEDFYKIIESEGHTAVKHVQADGMDYRHVTDFRFEKELSQKITKHDIDYLQFADCAIVLAGKPSWGAAMELYEIKKQGKLVIVYAEKEVPTPWPISFADFVATDREQLSECLRKCAKITGERGPKLKIR